MELELDEIPEEIFDKSFDDIYKLVSFFDRKDTEDFEFLEDFVNKLTERIIALHPNITTEQSIALRHKFLQIVTMDEGPKIIQNRERLKSLLPIKSLHDELAESQKRLRESIHSMAAASRKLEAKRKSFMSMRPPMIDLQETKPEIEELKIDKFGLEVEQFEKIHNSVNEVGKTTLVFIQDLADKLDEAGIKSRYDEVKQALFDILTENTKTLGIQKARAIINSPKRCKRELYRKLGDT